MTSRVAIALLALTLCGTGVAQGQPVDGVRLLLVKLERIVQTADGVAFMATLGDTADRARARDFIGSELLPGSNRVVVQERDRQSLAGSLPGNGFRLIVDVFAEFGSRARVATWRLDVRRTGSPGTDTEWT